MRSSTIWSIWKLKWPKWSSRQTTSSRLTLTTHDTAILPMPPTKPKM